MVAKWSLVVSHEPLRVTLADLRQADTRGKWWLVGAAWEGDPLVEQQQQQQAHANGGAQAALQENALLRLAKKQGMNTDIRRNVFVVLMGSDVSVFLSDKIRSGCLVDRVQDYVDACERLAQLNLTEVQQREIVRVILHCCGNVSPPSTSPPPSLI